MALNISAIRARYKATGRIEEILQRAIAIKLPPPHVRFLIDLLDITHTRAKAMINSLTDQELAALIEFAANLKDDDARTDSR